MLRCITL